MGRHDAVPAPPRRMELLVLLFGLALDALDGALDAFFCTAIVIAHSSILSLAVVSSALFGCESVESGLVSIKSPAT
jgi:hypothetical protein